MSTCKAPSHSPFGLNQQMLNICLTLTSLKHKGSARGRAVHSHPQGHLQFDGGAGSGVLQRKALSQRHVLLRQQAAQRHRQITQGAFMLVVFHLCIRKEGALRQVSYFHHLVHHLIKNTCCKWRFYTRYHAALPPPRAPASWDCEPGMRNNLPTEAPCSCTGSLRTDRSFVSR